MKKEFLRTNQTKSTEAVLLEVQPLLRFDSGWFVLEKNRFEVSFVCQVFSWVLGTNEFHLLHLL